MEMARLAPNLEPQLTAIIDEWDRRTQTGRNGVDLDQLCKLKGVDPIHFIAVVGEAAQKFSNNASILVTAIQQPQVVQKSIDMALTDDGIKDRQLVLSHTGYLPTAPGTRIQILNKNSAKAEVNAAEPSKGFVGFEKRMETADEIDQI